MAVQSSMECTPFRKKEHCTCTKGDFFVIQEYNEFWFKMIVFIPITFCFRICIAFTLYHNSCSHSSRGTFHGEGYYDVDCHNIKRAPIAFSLDLQNMLLF